MSKSHIKHLLLALTCVFACAFVLVGCKANGVIPSAADMEKATTSAYFAEVNSVVGQFKGTLADFPTDVKEKNVTDMKSKLDDTQKLIDKFNQIDVPQNCTDIHKNYSDGLLQMQQALSDYISIYTSFVNGDIDNSVLNQRMANVQKSYSMGIDLLNKADKLAAEM